MAGNKTCRMVGHDCGLREQAQYGGAVLVALVDSPWKVVSAFGAAMVTALTGLWDGTPVQVQKLVVAAGVLWLLDVAMGVLRAWRRPEEGISSNRFGCSVTKAAVYGLSMVAAEAVDEGLGLGNAALTALATLIVIREATSFVENSALLGFPWPKAIADRLAAIRRAAGEETPCDPGGGSGPQGG
ncbi:MAG: hypothetical protein HPY69_05040 [Armatimonadetes bacterium]|nr:hypothetical protein [Armatimonadota bacterium]